MENKMRKFCLIIAIFGIAMIGTLNVVYSQAQWSQSNFRYGTTPLPFSETGQQDLAGKPLAAMSTGYFFVNNIGMTSAIYNWRPQPYTNIGYPASALTPGGLLSTDYEPNLWWRIYPGPRSVPIAERESGITTDDNGNVIVHGPLGNDGLPGRMPQEGYRFFRNPSEAAIYTSQSGITGSLDSTYNAFAGPIPIGFAFYMNGLRYDSFYVSTCGIIALSNRRYLYDGDNNRAVPPNRRDCYDINSADWPFRQTGTSTAQLAVSSNGAPGTTEAPDLGRFMVGRGNPITSIIDPVPDNYGFQYIALGGSLDARDGLGGIRSAERNTGQDNIAQGRLAEFPSIYMRLSDRNVSGAAYITPFEGPFYMPQTFRGQTDDRGQVWYKRSAANNNLIIYFKNFHLRATQERPYVEVRQTAEFGYRVEEGRVGITDNLLEGSVQVELNSTDSSITFRYGDWGAGSMIGQRWAQNTGYSPSGSIMRTAWDFFQGVASTAVGGFARHTDYNANTGMSGSLVTEDNPWAGQYMQFTRYGNGFPGYPSIADPVTMPAAQFLGTFTSDASVKFKQWRNSLRLVDIQYMMRKKEGTAVLFDEKLNTAAARNYYNPIELLANHQQLGQIQPVAIVQNLTNDIQGPKGVNFVAQDFQFQSHVRIANKITEKVIYNRIAKIADTCITDYHTFPTTEERAAFCGAEQVAWTDVEFSNGIYTATPHSPAEYDGEEAAPFDVEKKGISPYNFAQITFPTFIPNENLEDQLGLMELTAFTDATNPNTGAKMGDEWSVDDSANVSFWVISRVAEFRSNGEFHYHRTTGFLPDVTKWVHSSFAANNISVTVEEGGASSAYSKNPLPPLGQINPVNTNATVPRESPLYVFQHGQADGPGGSKITSYPIDMRTKERSFVTLGVQKGASSLAKNRGFSDEQMLGPEPRVAFKNVWESFSTTTGQNNTGAGRFGDMRPQAPGVQKTPGEQRPDPDYLFVEYLYPSPDGVKNIISTGLANGNNNGSNVNDVLYTYASKANMRSDQVGNDLWRNHKEYNPTDQTYTSEQFLHTPALAVFGGGGYFLGWTFADGKTFRPVNWNRNLTSNVDQYGGGTALAINKNNIGAGYYVLTDNSGEPGANDSVVAGLMPNPYDVGFDDEFQRYSVIIPDYFMFEGPDDGKNFRFRIKSHDIAAQLQADGPVGAGKGVVDNPSDDLDNFLVDNVAVVFNNTIQDLEAQAVRVLWPYHSVPITQATGMQTIGRITNMGSADASAFNVKIRAYKGAQTNNVDVNTAIYCQSRPVPGLPKGETIEITGSNLSLREFATNTTAGSNNVFTIQMIITSGGREEYTLNDTIYSQFTLTLDSVISYTANNTNEVPAAVGIEGKGINTGGSNFGGYSTGRGSPTKEDQILFMDPVDPGHSSIINYWSNTHFGFPWADYVCGGNLDQMVLGYPHSYISGQIAVKFEVRALDSIRGVVAQFGGANQEFNDISFNVYTDNNGLPGQAINNVSLPLIARRLHSKAASGAETLRGIDIPILYEFARPVQLEPGTYWVSIDQRGETGLELAATGESMGMRTMLVQTEFDQDRNVNRMGVRGIQLLVDKRLRVPIDHEVYGRVYENNNIFAYKNVLGSGNTWQPFMPTSGQIAYPHLNHVGMLNSDRNNYLTLTRGTWAPLLKPYFGVKTVLADNNAHPCPDELDGGDGNPELAINISAFNGFVRDGAIELVWETTSETNNYSFIVEKAEAGQGQDTWNAVEHVLGQGNSTLVNTYRLRDADLVSGTTYKYRLYGMDVEGRISCQNSNIITIEYNNETAINLAQNTPNPFSTETQIDVIVPNSQYVTVEILDIFGKVVKTLVNNEILNGSKRYTWNGSDNAGMPVADGHYIYRLTAGNETITKKMSFIRAK